eukprot:GHVP01009230.1.p1 GENE.GHVP01009230.1~~GHVP01009230.1.p1  ORF type:complete len:1062 (-),score=128.11 GHVP01009230.1:77-3262(-)
MPLLLMITLAYRLNTLDKTEASKESKDIDISRHQFHPIPSILYQKANKSDQPCFMGFIPDIERVWLSIGAILYLWSPSYPDIESYNLGSNSVITNISYINEASFIVVISTEGISLIQVIFSNKKIVLQKKKKTLKTNVLIKQIKVEKERVFLSGIDGHIYELEYKNNMKLTKNTGSIFNSLLYGLIGASEEIVDMEIDSSNGLLYCLTKSKLRVFSYKNDRTFNEVNYIKCNDIIGNDIIKSICYDNSQIVLITRKASRIYCNTIDNCRVEVCSIIEGVGLNIDSGMDKYISTVNTTGVDKGTVNRTGVGNPIDSSSSQTANKGDGIFLYHRDVFIGAYSSTDGSNESSIFAVNNRTGDVSQETIEGSVISIEEVTREGFHRQNHYIVILTTLGLYFFYTESRADTVISSIHQYTNQKIELSDINKYLETLGEIEAASVLIQILNEEMHRVIGHEGLLNDLLLYSSSFDPSYIDGNQTNIVGCHMQKLNDGLLLYLSQIVKKIWRIPIRDLLESESKEGDIIKTQTLLIGLLTIAKRMGNEYVKEIQSIIETITLILLAKDYQLDISLIDFNREFYTLFSGLPYTKAVMSPIASMVVSKQLSIGGSIDTICEVLEKRCSLFFNSNEIKLYKGIDLLTSSEICLNEERKKVIIKESLRYIEGGNESINMELLLEILGKLKDMGLYDEAMRIIVRNGNLILNNENILYEILDLNKSNKKIYDICIGSKLKEFHILFYNYLNNTEYERDLVGIDSSFIEDYLKDNNYNLLILYYRRRGEIQSAIELINIIVRETNTPIGEKIELITRAISMDQSYGKAGYIGPDQSYGKGEYVTSRSGYTTSRSGCTTSRSGCTTSRSSNGQLDHLREVLVVLQIQKEILTNIKGRDRIEQLKYKVHTLSSLFNDFVIPERLYIQALKIVNISGQIEKETVNYIWKNIIEEESKKGMNFLRNRLNILGKMFFKYNHCYDLEKLLFILMDCCVLNEDEWIVDTLMDCGINIEKIIDSLESISRNTMIGGKTSHGNSYGNYKKAIKRCLDITSRNKIYNQNTKYRLEGLKKGLGEE